MCSFAPNKLCLVVLVICTKLTPIHDLRHSFASTLVNNGATLYEVQKLLGHSRSATTERYAHLANHRLQRAASLIDKAYS